ncbi:hypothetical protein BV898_09120 [Hypsibius exemplaris]|uniref:Gustatory receptor n=1 Tax=Hypsibius exemplaris TaxID=2072580 RepID=A0A1W0WNR7_HYPEX|nr:hypothetical protein BV898_09120 [Hypsibius exemplaris]
MSVMNVLAFAPQGLKISKPNGTNNTRPEMCRCSLVLFFSSSGAAWPHLPMEPPICDFAVVSTQCMEHSADASVPLSQPVYWITVNAFPNNCRHNLDRLRKKSLSYRGIVLACLQATYWTLSTAIIIIMTINSITEIKHLIDVQEAHSSVVPGLPHPLIDLICDVQHWIEAVRGITLCLWLHRRRDDFFALFSRFSELIAPCQIGPSDLKALRKMMLTRMGVVTAASASVAAVIAYSWFKLFASERMDFYPFETLSVGSYTIVWLLTCVLTSLLSRMITVMVTVLAGVLCLCLQKLMVELERTCRTSRKLPVQYLWTDIRFRYLQILAAADALGKTVGVFILVGLLCDIVSVCGYIGRNFQNEETQYETFVTMGRSIFCGVAIAGYFIMAMHYPLVQVYTMGQELLQHVYKLQRSPNLRFLLENDAKARGSLDYLEDTILKRPVVISAADVLEFTGKLPQMIIAILISYPYLLYQVIKEQTNAEKDGTPCAVGISSLPTGINIANSTFPKVS